MRCKIETIEFLIDQGKTVLTIVEYKLELGTQSYLIPLLVSPSKNQKLLLKSETFEHQTGCIHNLCNTSLQVSTLFYENFSASLFFTVFSFRRKRSRSQWRRLLWNNCPLRVRPPDPGHSLQVTRLQRRPIRAGWRWRLKCNAHSSRLRFRFQQGIRFERSKICQFPSTCFLFIPSRLFLVTPK